MPNSPKSGHFWQEEVDEGRRQDIGAKEHVTELEAYIRLSKRSAVRPACNFETYSDERREGTQHYRKVMHQLHFDERHAGTDKY